MPPERDRTQSDEEMLAPTVDAVRAAPADSRPSGEVVTLEEGAILGGVYRVQRRLGQGGMGTVYVVEHTDLKKRFAAKVVSSKKLSESAIKRLLNEARVTSGIDHENIVEVVNLGRQEDGTVFVIMELLEGEDLRSRLDRRFDEDPDAPWLPHDEVVAYVPQILDGLAAAHDAGVIHRDLKPDNVFLVQKDDGPVTVKLLDFGIARNLEAEGDHRLTRTGQIIGTPLYMAPEQARNMSDADGRADLYAVGVILYEMVTGAPPFEADTLFDLIVQHATEPPVPPRERRPDLPAPVESVILRCLEKERDLRFDDARALRAAWEDALRGIEPAPSRPPAPPEGALVTPLPIEPTPTSAGPPRVAIYAFVGTFVVGLIAALGFVLSGRAEPVAADPDPVSAPPAIEAPREPVAPAPEAPPTTVSRVLQTDPQGATVSRDGETLGTTPLNLEVPAGGALTVRVSQEGYQTIYVDVRGDSTERMDVALAPDGPRRGRSTTRRRVATPDEAPPATPPIQEPHRPVEAPPPPIQTTRRRSSGQILLGMDQFEREQGR
ncbi:MAG: serine/threonine protein kinase [Myxococcales bacterium]|nr:serine/threonine protein kinase [Myxococcales bacterium]